MSVPGYQLFKSSKIDNIHHEFPLLKSRWLQKALSSGNRVLWCNGLLKTLVLGANNEPGSYENVPYYSCIFYFLRVELKFTSGTDSPFILEKALLQGKTFPIVLRKKLNAEV